MQVREEREAQVGLLIFISLARHHLLRQHRARHAHGLPVCDHGELGTHPVRGNGTFYTKLSIMKLHLTQLYPPLTIALSENEIIYSLGLKEKVFYFYFLSVRPCKY